MPKRKSRSRETFLDNVARGRRFETLEKAEWKSLDDGIARFEAPTAHRGRKGRIDILIEELGDFVSIVELKATDWDRILLHRIRPTAQRHARQIWRYIEKEIDEGKDVCPGIAYCRQPSNTEVKLQVEELLNDRAIQVVWREQEAVAPEQSHEPEGGNIGGAPR